MGRCRHEAGLVRSVRFDAIRGCGGGLQNHATNIEQRDRAITLNRKHHDKRTKIRRHLERRQSQAGRFYGAGLLGLVQDLYNTSEDNQNFLHARLGLECDVLKPYKTIIERWLWPDVYKNQEYSVSKAKKPITDYKKASGLLLCRFAKEQGDFSHHYFPSLDEEPQSRQ
jgi:hypothetical protein